MFRTLAGTAVAAGFVLALIGAAPAAAVPATIPPGGVSVSSLTPASGPLVLTPTFGGVVCPAESTQVQARFFGGNAGPGEIPEATAPQTAGYVIGDPARFTGFGIDELASRAGVPLASLAGRYAYQLNCIDDFGLPTPGATTYYALVDVVGGTGLTGTYTFVPPVGATPTPTTPAPTTTTPAPTTTTPAPTTTTPAPTTTTPAPTTTSVSSGTTTSTGSTTTSVTSATTSRTLGSTTTASLPSPTTTRSGGALPLTGPTVAPLIGIAVLLVGGGAAVLVAARRRAHGSHSG